MFELIEAVSYVKTMSNGRTRPMLILCEAEGPEGLIDVVVKLSGGCELKEKSLIREAIASFFGIDIGLPIPCPYQVLLSPEFVASIPDSDAKSLAQRSSPIAFGCHLVDGYATIAKNISLSGRELDCAANIFAFDLILGNPDRCIDRPNCLYNGTAFAIFDHELAFSHFDLLFGAPSPWVKGDGAKMVAPVEQHIFYRVLNGKILDFAKMKQDIGSITASRFDGYKAALPAVWSNDSYAEALIVYLKDVQLRLDDTITEIRRVLA